ncbi:hypothetical protein AWM79_03925 [Pseudomonas agarici]|uniref:DUF3509 domain-containing protein n=1 Tax=Pseudomonas agarici TaxID=46677 RepID=A0A0X1T8E4_PSEAA|nr:DUF3509 domain-containing protein [Pseudomonas agarici]AMB88212.1 hypothetical protein AWM79_03925 [Pseudomonas agarici]NWB89699.1 DUF3509 domain-containing protein [Pseudomonas agarici]NWC10240.1 DUF3509 domain-containing protein [Pseudomonas agarici]SEK19347.1 Protein of unknown function [Pseudomonas agarici]
MESISLLLNEALSPYAVTLTPSGGHGECVVSVKGVTGLILLERRVNQAQLTDKRLLTDVVDGLHRDLRIVEGRLEPCMLAAWRNATEHRMFRAASR